MRIDDVNRLTLDEFVTTFGPVYESTPSLAAAAWANRPFRDVAELVDTFLAAAASLDGPGVLALLQAHPQLAAPAAMTVDSANEQQAAGLIELDQETRARIDSANARYLKRFGFPFIIAVRGLEPADIVAALNDRMGHDPSEERATALAQVQRIAELRITQLVSVRQ